MRMKISSSVKIIWAADCDGTLFWCDDMLCSIFRVYHLPGLLQIPQGRLLIVKSSFILDQSLYVLHSYSWICHGPKVRAEVTKVRAKEHRPADTAKPRTINHNYHL